MLPGDVRDVAVLTNSPCRFCGYTCGLNDRIQIGKKVANVSVRRQVCPRCHACGKCFLDDAVVVDGGAKVMCPICGLVEETKLSGDPDDLVRLTYVTAMAPPERIRPAGRTQQFFLSPDMLELSQSGKDLASVALAYIDEKQDVLDKPLTEKEVDRIVKAIQAAKENQDRKSPLWMGLNVAEKLLISKAICAGQQVELPRRRLVGRVHDPHTEVSREQVDAFRTFHRLFGEEK